MGKGWLLFLKPLSMTLVNPFPSNSSSLTTKQVRHQQFRVQSSTPIPPAATFQFDT